MANEGSTKPTYSELEAENLRVRGLLQRLRVAADDVASKLESQVCRESSLPEAYRAILQTYWKVSRDLPTFRDSSSLVSQGAESADIGKLDTAADEKKPRARIKAKCGTCGGTHDD